MASGLRLLRLRRPGGAILMVPLDHGMSMGPLQGLQRPAAAIEAAATGGATCLAVHKGLVPFAVPHARDLGLLLHLSASTDTGPDPLDKRLVATVEEALRLGCDGVSVHVNAGSPTEGRQLEEAGLVSTSCNQWSVPLVAMMYARGPGVKDPQDARLVANAARLGAELGADVVKVPYTGSTESFKAVVEGCPVPVVVSGGPRRDFDAFLTDLRAARAAGAVGASVGRNVFQQPDPRRAMAAVADVFA